MKYYKPLEIEVLTVDDPRPALEGMRLPKKQTKPPTREADRLLASKLVLAGDEHAKAMRSILVHIRIKAGLGWLVEYLTYEVGVIPVSSSSTMHTSLRELSGEELAEQKQADLPSLIYTRQDKISYQTIRRMYLQRRHHRHPDWQIFCDWIETLPHFDWLIYPDAAQLS